MAARRHLERIAATPRPAGSPAEAEARRYCTDILTTLGFDVTEERFDYSAAPGLWATSSAGVASTVALGIAARLGSIDRPVAALAVMGASLLIGLGFGTWVARRGVLDFPLRRREGINLRAVRAGAEPVVWLVAHLDSKSQPVPTAARAAGIIATVIVWVAALGLGVAAALGADTEAWWGPLFVAGLIGGLPVAASVVGAHSPGALDNASGVATVLEAAARVRSSRRIGVLLTSAEELGLAGARAVARRHPRSVALNCDGVDDRGTLICMRRAGGSVRAVTALEAAASRLGIPLTVRGLVPGLLVDSVAFADAGWDAATLSRGSWSTLARIHRPHDDLRHLSGAGVEEAASVLAAAAQQIDQP